MNPEATPKVTEDVRPLVGQESFERWRKDQSVASGRPVIVNKSFLFRIEDTNKADEYLAVPVRDNGLLTLLPPLASCRRLNLDYKYMVAISSLPATPAVEPAATDGTTRRRELLPILAMRLMTRCDEATQLTQPCVSPEPALVNGGRCQGMHALHCRTGTVCRQERDTYQNERWCVMSGTKR